MTCAHTDFRDNCEECPEWTTCAEHRRTSPTMTSIVESEYCSRCPLAIAVSKFIREVSDGQTTEATLQVPRKVLVGTDGGRS